MQGKPERLVRPLQWMLALLNDAIVPVDFAGVVASDVTFGHRVLFGYARSVYRSPQNICKN